jgi:phosphate ABC transporter, permease protein PstC
MRHSSQLNHLLKGSALISISVLALILIFVLSKSLPFIQQIGFTNLWLDDGWFPTENKFNLIPMVLGSLYIMTGAVLLASPIGIILAIFLQYYAPPKVAIIYRSLIELLAGIPSVVYGFWGLIVLVPLISNWVPPGASVLAACIVLALMILPLVTLMTDSALSQIPEKWVTAADALAINRWSKIWKIALPHAMPSIIAGTTLQAGRALGETMAVLMVCGNIVQIPHSIFEPARTLTANIALEMAYATDHHVSALYMSGLVLLIITILLTIFMIYANKKNFVV